MAINSIVRKQLERAGLPTDQLHLFIPRKIGIRLEEDQCYLIKVPTQFNMNEPWITNWNQGRVPSHPYYKVDVSKIMNDMIKVNGIAYDLQQKSDLDEAWMGWLPIDCIEVLEKL